MNRFVFLFVSLALVGCSETKFEILQEPKEVIIAGRINPINPDKAAPYVSVNRPGLGQAKAKVEIDSLGNFIGRFKSYLPADIWIGYETNFLVLAHPGDSIYVEFDGLVDNRPELFKTLKISGTATKLNQQAIEFQKLYFAHSFYTDWDGKKKAQTDLDMDEYLEYLDSLKTVSEQILTEFINNVSPTKEVETWARVYIEQDYFDKLASYPRNHQMYNNLKPDEWDVPITFYDSMLNRLPLDKSMLISGYALSNFVNRFHYSYAWENRIKEMRGSFVDENNKLLVSKELYDSASLFIQLAYTPDPILKQLLATEILSQQLDRPDFSFYEKYPFLLDSIIAEPFLKNPLIEKYEKAKERLEKPKISSDAILKKIQSSSVKELMDSIRADNQNKVLYIDFWATWCGPCKSEMPLSKELEKSLNTDKVAFIYLCIDSEEKNWKACLDEFQLGGQHYLLTEKQSQDISKAFDIKGIPFYCIIDKEGNIVDQGNHIRPSNHKTKEIIDSLI